MEILLGICIGIIVSNFGAAILLRRQREILAAVERQRDSFESDLKVERRLSQERTSFFEDSSKLLNQSFKSISADVLGETNRNFMQLAETVFSKYEEKTVRNVSGKEDAINRLVDPISKSLEDFNQQVRELERQRAQDFQSVKEQVEALRDTNRVLLHETGKLAGALRAPTSRGRWGELQLKRIVELAGMLEYCDFSEQPTFSTEGQRARPDLLIQLPGDKFVVVDAKVPLTSYLDAMETDSSERRTTLLNQHAQQIRRQVTELSKKAYWAALDGSPEFVILFLPGESFFSAALEVQPALIEHGVEEKVIIATPTTLIAMLRTIATAWRHEVLADNSQYIALLGKELYQRLCDFSFHMGDIGKNLGSSVSSYNKAIGTLESRVLATTRKFKSLGVEEGKKTLVDLRPVNIEARTPSLPN